MPDIKTLIPDITKLLQEGKTISDEDAKALGDEFAKLIKDRLAPREKKGELRMSNFGSPDRQLWYSVNAPDKREAIDGATYFKFLFGDVVELLALFLAKQAGHTVEYQQIEVDLYGMKGHPDAIIDGVLVDVKSASGYGMQKFERHQLEDNDPFHYLYQLSSYLESLKNDDTLKVKKEGAFFAVDKSSGKMVLDTYKKQDIDFEGEINSKREMLAGAEPPKERCYPDVADGLSGNRKLGVECSYCGFKKTCWPGLRSFAYSGGARHLTVVKKEPDVNEVS